MKAALLLVFGLVFVRDLGQWNDVSPEQREWALAQNVPDDPRNGDDRNKSCCSTADGVKAMETMRNGQYWVTFSISEHLDPVGPMPVPPERILTGSKFGPKVWWWNDHGSIKIRCYAPGPAT